ncbi:TPA: paraslipin, partial [Neisseria meningitidis]
MEFFIILLVAVAVFGFKSFVVIPQQEVHVVERLGRFHRALTAGLNILIPFIDRVAYRHSLKEIPLDVPSQVCITRDNTQLTVDGIIYFQVTDPKLASYGSSNYIMAITQLAQTTLRSVIGRMELDKTFEERDEINSTVVSALDEAAGAWGVKVLRYEIKDLVPPQEILRSMQAQITAEREKRARIAESEGRKIEQINLASGQREAEIQQSEGEAQAAVNASNAEKIARINRAKGEAESLRLVAEANAEAIRQIAAALQTQG